MSEPFQQVAQQEQQHPYGGSHGGWGPVGPVLGALAVILVLGAAAVAVGRLCSGRRVFGYGQYDVEGWMEAKCASCIDGSIDPPLPTRGGGGGGGGGGDGGPVNAGVPIVVPVEMAASRVVEEQHPPGQSQAGTGEP